MKNLMIKVGVGSALLAVSASSFATAIVDYTAAAVTASTELASAVTSGLPLFGTIVAIGVGMRIIYRFWSADEPYEGHHGFDDDGPDNRDEEDRGY